MKIHEWLGDVPPEILETIPSDEFSDELPPSPNIAEMELENLSRLPGGVLPTLDSIYGEVDADVDSEATEVDTNMVELWEEHDRAVYPEIARKHSLAIQNALEQMHKDLESESESLPEPTPKRRKTTRGKKFEWGPSERKKPLGGSPRREEYEEEGDELEPEHDESDDEHWTLYSVDDEAKDPPLYFLALWEAPLMQKHPEVRKIVGDGKRSTLKLRRRLADTSREEARQVLLLDEAPIREPNFQAYSYYMWVRREYGFAHVPELEMFEKTHLMKSPDHPSGIRICDGFLRAGFKIPIPRLTISLLNFFKKAPCQLTSTAYAQIALVLAIGEHLQREISLEEFLSMYSLQLAGKGEDLYQNMISGHAVYTFNRRPRIGFFHPPSKLSYKQSQVFELYGNFEPEVGGHPYHLEYRSCNDYDVKDLNEVGAGRVPIVISQIAALNIEERRAAFPNFSTWFPDELKEEERCYRLGIPYLSEKEKANRAREDQARAEAGLPPIKRMSKRAASKFAPKKAAEVATRKQARVNVETSPRAIPVIPDLERQIDTAASEGLTVVPQLTADPASSSAPEPVRTTGKNASGNLTPRPPRSNPTPEVDSPRRLRLAPYTRIENSTTIRNRKFAEIAVERPEERFIPNFVDPEGGPITLHTSLADDPMAAGVYSRIVPPVDMREYENLLDGPAGEMLLSQSVYQDLARINAKTTAMIKHHLRMQHNVKQLVDKVKAGGDAEKLKASEDKVAELTDKFNKQVGVIRSLQDERKINLQHIKDLEAKCKACDEFYERSSAMEHERNLLKKELDDNKVMLATCQSDVNDLKTKMDQTTLAAAAVAAEYKVYKEKAEANVRYSRITVKRLERCIDEHAITCPSLPDEAGAMFALPEEEFVLTDDEAGTEVETALNVTTEGPSATAANVEVAGENVSADAPTETIIAAEGTSTETTVISADVPSGPNNSENVPMET